MDSMRLKESQHPHSENRRERHRASHARGDAVSVWKTAVSYPIECTIDEPVET
jgi:hypothetical protein